MSTHQIVYIDSTYNLWKFGGDTTIQTWMIINNITYENTQKSKYIPRMFHNLQWHLACQYIKVEQRNFFGIWVTSLYGHFKSLEKTITNRRAFDPFTASFIPFPYTHQHFYRCSKSFRVGNKKKNRNGEKIAWNSTLLCKTLRIVKDVISRFTTQ